MLLLVALLAGPQVPTFAPRSGIPTPPFGLTEQAPAPPDPWTTEVPGFYYIDKSGEGASNSRTYGHPGAPRATIPLKLPAGSVVEVHGAYHYSHVSPNVILAQGTATAPVFIRGFDTTVGRPLHVRGSYYIIENLTLKLAPSSEYKPFAVKIISPTDHGVLRHTDIGGNLGGGGIGMGSSSTYGGVISDVVIWDNDIHDSGDVASTVDQDCHSIAIGSGTSTVWVLENEIHDSSGSGVQVNAGSATGQPNTHHIYLGRNHVYRTRQAGLFVKQAVDVIVSQNLVHDVINTSWSPSKGLGFQYAPERVWFLYNEVYGCTYGIYSGSDSGQGIGKDTYHIGNVIHDIHHVPSANYNPNSAWGNAAIMLAGGVNRSVVGNTIYNVDGGILSPSSAGKMDIVNNVITKISEPEGVHIFVENGGVATNSAMTSNLLDGPSKIKWGTATTRSLGEFQKIYANKGGGSVEADPRFVDPASANFDLSAGSPAIDTGTVVDVYTTFETLYGISIAKDKDRRPRPDGTAWDIGAYEAASTTCGNLRAEVERLTKRVKELEAKKVY